MFSVREKARGEPITSETETVCLKMTGGDSAQDHINKLQVLVDQLANIGHCISNEDQAFTFLGSLPPSYQTLVISL